MAETDPQTTQAFWDTAHSEDDHQLLTGSEMAQELRNTRASDFVGPGKRVLNIGVGRGATTRSLIEAGCVVSVHDISAVALERFRGQVEGAYLPADLPKLPADYFDVALSHLVVQHMSDEALAVQLEHVVRSLKANGILAVQFATHHEQATGTFSLKLNRHPIRQPYCRTLGRMAGWKPREAQS